MRAHPLQNPGAIADNQAVRRPSEPLNEALDHSAPPHPGRCLLRDGLALRRVARPPVLRIPGRHPAPGRGVYPLRNIAPGRGRYQADPSDQIDSVVDMGRRRLSIVAIYHSHVGHPPIPSAADLLEHRYGDTPRVIVSVGRDTVLAGGWPRGSTRNSPGTSCRSRRAPDRGRQGPHRAARCRATSRATRPVSSCGRALSRLFRWLGSLVGPGDGPRDRSTPDADPMWSRSWISTGTEIRRLLSEHRAQAMCGPVLREYPETPITGECRRP